MDNENNIANANRKYKDSVFTKLFGDKEKLAELYNAISGTNYTPDDIEITTLQNVLFMGKINDIAFILGNRLIVLIEHQSSINPNMPLRFLLYIARVYQELIDNEVMYGSRLVKIMPPEFIVMYNGVDDYPEESALNLSDAFIHRESLNLELTAKVYNVNSGRNHEIMSKSETLNGYAIFVARVRENINNGLEPSGALEKAVKDCVKDNILREFLTKHGSDVINMLNMEWNLDDAKKVWRKEAKLDQAEEIAEKLLKRGTPIEIVAEDTELSVERVLELKVKCEAKA